MTSPYDAPVVPIRWTGKGDFILCVTQTPENTDTLAIRNLTIADFKDILAWSDARDNRGPLFTVVFYDGIKGEGLFRLPTCPQSVASSSFNYHLRNALVDMGRLDTTTVKCYDTSRSASHGFSRVAEPDGSVIPRSRLRTGTQTYPFPSVMVQVAHSPSYLELKRVMQSWFHMSNGQVKIVILIKIWQRPSGRHQMAFEKWKFSSGLASCDSQVGIQLKNGTATQYGCRHKPSDFEITVPEPNHLPMTLEFELICDRKPMRVGEGDLILNDMVFRQIAMETWEVLRAI